MITTAIPIPASDRDSQDIVNESPAFDSDWQRLALRARRKLDWDWLPTTVAGTPWKIANAVDPDQMLLDACRRQDAGEQGVIDPFWATTWRAADGLDQFLNQLDLRDQRVLELGCGTGRAGLAAALRGAQVTLTDGVSDPLLLVRLTTYPLQHRCRVRRLRFAEDRLPGERFPIVLGSDITYLRELWPKLLICLEQHLANTGAAYLSDPYRSICTEFSEWMQSQPWKLEVHRVVMPDDPSAPIRVMKLTRR